jgi:hypothetical protein
MLIFFFYPGMQITWIDSCEIWGFHGGEDDDVLLGFGTM